MESKTFDIVVSSPVSQTFRTERVGADFDLRVPEIRERFAGEIAIPDDWNVGLIVGASGTGKSTIARELFGECVCSGFEWSAQSVIDDMPRGASVEEIERMFYAVGFGSVPSWLKPFRVLSNGERMRVELARALLSDSPVVCFDEFTSVVDRRVAETACIAVAKAVRRTGRRFVAVSCHRDVTEWLAPDWAFDTETMQNFRQPAAHNTDSASEGARRANGGDFAAITI